MDTAKLNESRGGNHLPAAVRIVKAKAHLHILHDSQICIYKSKNNQLFSKNSLQQLFMLLFVLKM